ncbi:glycosyltransferase [Deinococcus sp. Marseille-Q6407]|uniref:glycosyltransferase n=1 Tax=Deinococcus sp. Marseille-Q6407 TaxID=2969223 RepID=UPI0021BEF996|nr:glycosyltransferase family 4 protein [Deinococcus sp. Marseille-Q6407]
MRVSIVLEQRFLHTPDGATYDNGHATAAHWQRYLATFEEVQVVGRSQLVSAVPPGYRRVDAPGVTVLHVPSYQGPVGLLRRLPAVVRTLQRGIEPEDAVIVRLSGLLGHLAAALRQAQHRPFAAEVINDPYMGYGPAGTQHPLRPLFRVVLTGLTQRQCRQAGAVQYVTREALQRRYPPRRRVPSFGVSDVHLPPEAFREAPRAYSGPGPLAVLVGSLEQPHKAVDVAIGALALLRRRGQNVRLRIVGDGPLRSALEAQAEQAGVAAAVEFAGQRSTPQAVRADLAAAELFLIPSRTEGLPRALLEAQAQALPAIGSAVGGIPELLPPEYLVPPDNAQALADVWGRLAADPAALSAASARNLALARGYADDVLDRERTAFQRVVRSQATRKERP